MLATVAQCVFFFSKMRHSYPCTMVHMPRTWWKMCSLASASGVCASDPRVRFCIHKPGFRDASDNPAFSIIVCGRYCLPVHCASRLPNWVYSTLASFGSGRRRNLCPRRRHVFGRFSGRHTPFFSRFFQNQNERTTNTHSLFISSNRYARVCVPSVC